MEEEVHNGHERWVGKIAECKIVEYSTLLVLVFCEQAGKFV